MISSVEKEYFNSQLSGYKMTLTNGEVWSVPLDNNNKDKQAIDAWVADGNSIGEPA